MKKLLSILAVALFVSSAFAADADSVATNAEPSSPALEAKYTAVIESRTDGILKTLALSDTNKAARVHDLIIAQYRALNAWHTENDPKLKAARRDKAATAEIRDSLKKLHQSFLAGLAENLTPEQIEQVKDKTTYGKVQFTYAGYCAQYSNLSEANKQEILRLLKEAREEAMDGGSAKEKTAVFQRYKGVINNYLSKQGLHPDKT
jgi:Protein of unknown function (DUF3826)